MRSKLCKRIQKRVLFKLYLMCLFGVIDFHKQNNILVNDPGPSLMTMALSLGFVNSASGIVFLRSLKTRGLMGLQARFIVTLKASFLYGLSASTFTSRHIPFLNTTCSTLFVLATSASSSSLVNESC